MAGESPDKAEQQGSSQETTVPGGGGRDPRLSASRGTDSTPSSSSASEAPSEAADSPVRVDRPTAVFKALTPRAPEDDAPREAAETAEAEPFEPEESAEPAEPQEPSEPEGDRLKAAVAAWVATAPEEPGKAGGGSEADAEDEAVAPDGGTDPEDSEADVDVDADADADADADSEPEKPAGADAPAESWFAARKPAAEQPDEPDDAADASDTPDPADADADADVDADADSGDEEPVDQPTAMFKVVRPPVDQPTTALKLPSDLTGKDTAKGTDKGADPDSERTSTFLPLRADIPAERKAEQAQEASRTAATAKAAPAAAPEAPRAPGTPATAAAPALAEPERTRQQPLPPLPPLDLLAELTNTPPPPPTPLRTTLRRVRIWTPLVLLLLIVFAIAQMVRPLPSPALKLSAAPTYAFGGGELKMPWPGEGQGAVEVEGVGSMGTYGPQQPAPIASVTKTMTAYVILRGHPLKGNATGPEIEIDKKAADQGKSAHESTAPVQEGQTYSEKELLQLLMIPSANNVARLLARWDAGSETAFVGKMNAAAKELGMTRSTYTDPSGLLDSTVSTPQDQLKLAKAVMQYDVFREIVNMPNVTIDGIPGRIENNNKILLKPGVGGIKTGSSTPAGGNLLWSANTVVDGKNRRILGIVMGAKDAKLLDDKLQLSIDYSYELIERAQQDVTSAAVVRKGQVLGYVDDGLGGKTPVVATKELKAVGWPGLKVRLELTDGGRSVPHTGRAGDVVGQVSIGTGAGRVSSPVALQGDLAEPGFDKKLTRVG